MEVGPEIRLSPRITRKIRVICPALGRSTPRTHNNIVQHNPVTASVSSCRTTRPRHSYGATMTKLNMNILADFEAAQIKRELPAFGPGDTIVVNVKVKEGNRERVQAYEGVVIGKKNAGLNSAFTVRKISHGFGVERVFQTHSATIDSVEVKRRGKVRAGKLYYLRDLEGKAARIKEDLAAGQQAKAAKLAAAASAE